MKSLSTAPSAIRGRLRSVAIATAAFTALLALTPAMGTAQDQGHVRLVAPATVQAPEKVPFTTQVSKTTKRVAFYVDGQRRWVDRSQRGRFSRTGYLSTAHMATGRHKLKVRARLRNGRVASSKRSLFIAKKSKVGNGRKATSTTAEPTPASDLLFNGAHISDFALNQSAPGAVTEVSDPAGSGATALKMTVSEKDVYPITPTENPRAQLLSPSIIDPGEEFWWGSKFFLPGDFPASVPDWLTVLEGPYGRPFAGPPPFHLEISGSEMRWQRNGTYDWDIPWRMPLVRDRWVNVLLHQRFGADGWVEMWIDGQPVTFFEAGSYNPGKVAPTQRLNMNTMDSSNNGGPNFAVIQNYRKAGMFDSVSLFHGPMLLGATRASVGG